MGVGGKIEVVLACGISCVKGGKYEWPELWFGCLVLVLSPKKRSFLSLQRIAQVFASLFYITSLIQSHDIFIIRCFC